MLMAAMGRHATLYKILIRDMNGRPPPPGGRGTKFPSEFQEDVVNTVGNLVLNHERQDWHIGIGRYGQYWQNRYIGIFSSTSADIRGRSLIITRGGGY